MMARSALMPKIGLSPTCQGVRRNSYHSVPAPTERFNARLFLHRMPEAREGNPTFVFQILSEVENIPLLSHSLSRCHGDIGSSMCQAALRIIFLSATNQGALRFSDRYEHREFLL